MTNEPQILANVMDKTRAITKMYLKLLENTDWHQVFESNGKQLNSVFWLTAHLPVTENFLLLKCTGGEAMKVPFARQFGLGSVPPKPEECPPKDEVLSYFKEVHDKAIAHVASLDPAVLDQPNPSGFEFAGENSIRSIIIHAIRHEGTHAGHLGWLCKLSGIKTI